MKRQTEIIEKTAKVPVYPYGCITKGSRGNELADLDALAENVIAFTDDGKGVQSEDMMRPERRAERMQVRDRPEAPICGS